RCGGVSRRRHHSSGIERQAGVQRSIAIVGPVPIANSTTRGADVSWTHCLRDPRGVGATGIRVELYPPGTCVVGATEVGNPARWTFKLCTGGGFRMPACALADDGILALHDGQVIAASDWLLLDCAITSVSCERGLVVRYPIRMFEDLLPIRRIPVGEMVGAIA